jgi:septum formation protein
MKVLSLNMIILASASPRRRQLLELLHIPFSVIESQVDETYDDQQIPEEIVKELALRKANHVANKLDVARLVIGADTIVVLGQQILGKPKNRKHAVEILTALQGTEHYVYTGVAIVDGINGRCLVRVSKTLVRMRKLTQQQIERYVDSGEPMDKAGAYAIQGYGSVFVESIEGCYFNVVGLPLSMLTEMMEEFGYSLL